MADVTSTAVIVAGLPVLATIANRTGAELPASRVRRVTAYIDENLQRPLPLAELGAVVHMSPYHFARLFKRSTGMPPHRFVLHRRMQQARTLLAAGKMSIGEVARAVGFRTAGHFTTVFRRASGVTPTVYRAGQEAVPNRNVICDESARQLES
jgi:AraC family transcriptional regulator